MCQILLIGGSRDGDIGDQEFCQDKPIRFFNTLVTSSSLSGQATPPSEPEYASVENYYMDEVRIGDKWYAYASCRSIQGFEVIAIIMNSNLQPHR